MRYVVELGLSWRLDSRKAHSQRAFFSDGRSSGEYQLRNSIILNRRRQECRTMNAYSTVQLWRDYFARLSAVVSYIFDAGGMI